MKKNILILLIILPFPLSAQWTLFDSPLDSLCWSYGEKAEEGSWNDDMPQFNSVLPDTLQGVAYFSHCSKKQIVFFKKHPKLKYLSFYGHLKLSTLAPLQDSLVYLHLTLDQFKEDRPVSFPNLQFISTVGCERVFKRIPHFIADCPQLRYLSIELSEGGNWSALPSQLESLRIMGSTNTKQWTQIPINLFQLPKLRYLYFSFQTPQFIPLPEKINCLSLEVLDAPIDLGLAVNQQAIQGLPHLKNLFVEQWSGENFDALTQLQYIKYIYIRRMPYKQAKNLQKWYPNIVLGDDFGESP